MSLVNAFVQELDNEAATTRRVLERVPADKLTWKPHPKSMSLGQLALHVASAPGVTSAWAIPDVFEFAGGGEGAPQPSSMAEILSAHDKSVSSTKQSLTTIGDAGLHAGWKATAGGQTLMTMPKVAFVRAVVMNHWIHHRGQLSVYLRLLDVPVPSIYGPSADENPFAAAAGR
ncbi:MAG: DinB family protein [Acidobacteria bacterium]|nr:DinB family protein [Acidobacteriota bacterium]